MIQNYKHYNCEKHRKCLSCYNEKLTFYSHSLQLKKKMAAMVSTDNKTFQFRNDLLWTGLGEKYFLWAKAF